MREESVRDDDVRTGTMGKAVVGTVVRAETSEMPEERVATELRESQLQKTVGLQLKMALTCVLIAVLGGALSSLHYMNASSWFMNQIGLTLPRIRPVHTSFASLWIFGTSLAAIYHYLCSSGGGLSKGDLLRFRFHTICWITAGFGILVTLVAGLSSGREYLGFHPAFSAILLLGWFAFAYNFLRRLGGGFFGKPIYVWFWTTGTLYFIWTFLEGHAWLLPSIYENPIRDLQIQWKSCGTLVGSFNFLMYGSLIYATERITGSKAYGQSSTAFWLFGVGCLNSFTNYVHHTYHLPQSELAKWISFVVSMLEAIILVKVLFDLMAALRAKRASAQESRFDVRYALFNSGKWWTAAMLLSSLLLSVPPLNSLVHGTHVVVGHAMGTTIGIDTTIQLGVCAFLIFELRPDRAASWLNRLASRREILVLNVSAALLVVWLTVSGTVHGVHRYLGDTTPGWVTDLRWILPLAGACLGAAILIIVGRYLLLMVLPMAPARSAEQQRQAEGRSDGARAGS